MAATVTDKGSDEVTGALRAVAPFWLGGIPPLVPAISGQDDGQPGTAAPRVLPADRARLLRRRRCGVRHVPRVSTPKAVAGDPQRAGCQNGDITTVRALPAEATAPLVRRVCAFDRQIMVIPREPRPPAAGVDLVCVQSPR
jgi:hypothetical protein